MAVHVAEIRAAIDAQGVRRIREPYSERVQKLVAAYAREARREGQGWRRIATAVGMSPTTVERYVRRHGEDERVSMVPVVVSSPDSPARHRPLVLVSPSGFRLEGLALDEAAQLLDVLR